MPRKHHTAAEALLQAVIADLQDENPHRYAGGIRALVFQGPLHLVALRPEGPLHLVALRPEVRAPADNAARLALLRAELWAFLRELVRLRGGREGVFGNGIWLTDALRLVGNTAGERVTLGIEANQRDAAILQLAFLVERVGLGNVRLCPCLGCPRVFVKTYRREFCSVQCQKRHYMRKARATARLQREQQERRRRRLKGASA